VKMPSKWPGEYDVAQVDYVQFIGSRGGYEVDLLPLKPIGQSLYRLPGRKPASIRSDVAKLGRLDAEYVAASDAYRVDEAALMPLGGKKAPNEDVTAEGLREYGELKAGLLREAVLLGVAGAAFAVPFYGADIATAWAAGAAAGCTYLLLLSKETDSIAGEPLPRVIAAIAAGRLGVPLVLVTFLAVRQGTGTGGLASLSSVPRPEFVAAVLGFLSYKAPLLVKQVTKAITELNSAEAEVPITAGAMPTGSLGMAIKLAQTGLKKKDAAAAAADAATAAAAQQQPQILVLCGPSGVGKTTLIGRLLAEEPERVGFSVSCTTRPKRPTEVDGADYFFKSEEQFAEMSARGEFVESATVGLHQYGTSVGGIEQVSESGRLCILDIDVQGVQALRGRTDMRPFCVWVAPPSLEALRTRLERRGTEDTEEVNRRMKRARDEIESSLTMRCFDKIIVNDNLESAYNELKETLLSM